MTQRYKALKVRIYPNQEQETLILKSIGCSRFVFNKMLEERVNVYETIKDDREALYRYKWKTPIDLKKEYDFLKEVSKFVLDSARLDISSAFQNFFNSLKGIRKGAKVGFPKFKKKGKWDSYREYFTNGNIQVSFASKKVKLPKLGWIPFCDLRESAEGKIKQATVSRSKTGKYFVSFLFETEEEPKEAVILKNPKVIGLDMSLQNFFVDNDGNSPAYERLYRNNQKKIVKLQRKAIKKVKGSKNREKAELRVNKVFEKITNSRKDFTQKLSTSLVRNFDVIVVESLSLKGMSQALNLGKSVMDLGYSAFVNQLNYKAKWQGKILIEADKWFASSKMCSFCGYKKDLLLQERSWECTNCGRSHNRDQNAGINLRNFGLDKLGLGRPDVKPGEKNAADFGIAQNQVFSRKQEAAKSLASR